MSKKLNILLNTLSDEDINLLNIDDWVILDGITDYYLLGKWMTEAHNLFTGLDDDEDKPSLEEFGFDIHNDLNGIFSKYGYIFNKKRACNEDK